MRNGAVIPLGGGTLVAGVVLAIGLSGSGRDVVGALQSELTLAEAASTKAFRVSSKARDNTEYLEQVLARAEQTAAADNPAAPTRHQTYGVGRPAHREEIAAWDIDVLPDGRGLPAGSGDVWTGEEVFAERCASCHGDFAEGVDNWPVLAGGLDTLDDKDPVKTVGSYWPYLSTVWDYVNRSMPFGEAQSLTPDEVYAITAYILYSSDLVEDDFELNHENFAGFEMYNKDGFIIDDRAGAEYKKWRAEPCMVNCKPSVEITMRASVLDVTPDKGEADTLGASEQPLKEVSLQEQPAPPDIETESEIEVASVQSYELVDHGASVFRKCASCHMVGPNAKSRAGPPLNNLIGSSIGSYEGFKYSAAMAALGASGQVWTEENLTAFLENPNDYAPETKMAFRGLSGSSELDEIITYLSAFSDLADSAGATPEVVQGFTVASAILAIQGDVEYGEYLASECTTCHQASGNNDGIPNIVGLEIEPFVTGLHAYREKHRDNPIMQLVAGRLADDEIAALAAYFRNLEE